jgi:hypothetical protein
VVAIVATGPLLIQPSTSASARPFQGPAGGRRHGVGPARAIVLLGGAAFAQAARGHVEHERVFALEAEHVLSSEAHAINVRT